MEVPIELRITIDSTTAVWQLVETEEGKQFKLITFGEVYPEKEVAVLFNLDTAWIDVMRRVKAASESIADGTL